LAAVATRGQSDTAQSHFFVGGADEGIPANVKWVPSLSKASVCSLKSKSPSSNGTSTLSSVQERMKADGAGTLEPVVSLREKYGVSASSSRMITPESEAIDISPPTGNLARAEKMYPEQKESPPLNPPSRKMTLEEALGRRPSRRDTSSSRSSSSLDSKDVKLDKRAESGSHTESGVGLRSASKQHGDSLRRSREATPLGDSFRRSSDATSPGGSFRRSFDVTPPDDSFRRSNYASPLGDSFRILNNVSPAGDSFGTSGNVSPMETSGEGTVIFRGSPPVLEAATSNESSELEISDDPIEVLYRCVILQFR
jgi:hypothetical protein